MRIMTWNLWWRFGPWERRQGAIAAVLRAERPDICGLQEVWSTAEGHLAERLAAELGMHLAWAPALLPPHWRERLPADAPAGLGVGLAVLSRWPVEESAVVPLPRGDGPDEGRVALYARIAAPGGPVPFFTTHLHSGPAGSGVRCAQVRTLARLVADRRGGGAFPPVVTGDFNAEPDSDEIRLLGGRLTAPAVPGQMLLDAWRYAGPGQPSATWDTANPYLADGLGLDIRVDYIHTGLPAADGTGRVRSVRRAGDGPVDGVWPSDHFAVVAELEA
ncbi:endonuclease/exonuclease/phosphatase family protein [Streptomyces carpaticus]